jgi:hypothetical protein
MRTGRRHGEDPALQVARIKGLGGALGLQIPAKLPFTADEVFE